VRRGPIAAVLIACTASCATQPLVSGEARDVDRLPIAPYEAHEQCAELSIGERLDYRYESSSPLDFDIRYREANAVVSPIVRSHSTADSGIFEARVPARYCLDWQAGATGAIIGYRLLVRNANR
jgi:hypothetical protein